MKRCSINDILITLGVLIVSLFLHWFRESIKRLDQDLPVRPLKVPYTFYNNKGADPHRLQLATFNNLQDDTPGPISGLTRACISCIGPRPAPQVWPRELKACP